MKIELNTLIHDEIIWVDPKRNLWGELITDVGNVYGYAYSEGLVFLREDDREWVN